MAQHGKELTPEQKEIIVNLSIEGFSKLYNTEYDRHKQ